MSEALPISQQLINEFAGTGVVVVRGLVDADAIATLAAGIDYNIKHPSPRAKVASKTDDKGRFFEDFCTGRTSPNTANSSLKPALPKRPVS